MLCDHFKYFDPIYTCVLKVYEEVVTHGVAGAVFMLKCLVFFKHVQLKSSVNRGFVNVGAH